jgi:hypothetical protein
LVGAVLAEGGQADSFQRCSHAALPSLAAMPSR